MRHSARGIGIAVVMAVFVAVGLAQQPPALRLYVFDGGVLESDPARYHLTPAEVKTTQLSVAAFLVVHPRGTLMWDSGAIADDSWTPTGAPVARHLTLSNGQPRTVTLRATLKSQLAAAGYTPDRITFFALSHYHWDHVANANQFASATWLVRKVERDGMFPQPALEPPQPSTFAALQASKTTIVDRDDYDVFGDGTVVIKKAAGHTPGHQVLYVKLPRTGGVVLSGDLAHFKDNWDKRRVPSMNTDKDQSAASMRKVSDLLARENAQLWINHDKAQRDTLKMSPQYYD
jgi:glyoxylase-like metal-dependent hydrolase (beta-lactamase superfamily II)